jgi:hypothetical protein|tara:strand:+ start:1797 stop:2111 length:315 start_codon:yes stop_codon:yes gene_type:complete
MRDANCWTIPEFLRRDDGLTHEERMAKLRRLSGGTRWKMPGPKPKPKRKPRQIDFGLRLILRGLSWTDSMIDRLSFKEADAIALSGFRMMPADEVRLRNKEIEQ